METNSKDIYARVTQQILQAIEEGAPGYLMPWHFNGGDLQQPRNAVSKRPYRGVNIVALFATARTRGYSSSVWATYNQWHSLGAQVRKGEKSAFVVLWKLSDKPGSKEREVDGEHKQQKGQMLLARGFSVFNVSQVDGYQAEEPKPLSEAERIEKSEQFFAALGAEIKHEGEKAFYSIKEDRIVLPPFSLFRNALRYYSTLAHETTHWSGAKHRLDRDLTGRFGLSAYAMEELVAELGAAFLCSRLQIPTDPRRDHAAYIQDWLRVLKRDKKAIFTAATKAQQAADWLVEKSGALQPSMAA